MIYVILYDICYDSYPLAYVPGASSRGGFASVGDPSICRMASYTPTPALTARFKLRTWSSSMGIRRMPPLRAHASCASSGNPVVSAPKRSQSPGRYAPSSACGRAPNLLRVEVGVEFKGVRGGVERRRGVSGSKAARGWAERDERRERKSSRNRMHRADAVVRGPA